MHVALVMADRLVHVVVGLAQKLAGVDEENIRP